MKNIYIYCEGPTEELFINSVLAPYLFGFSIIAIPIVCTTKRTISTKYKGGVSSYSKLKNELSILARQHKNEYVTTMFDYYAMPKNTPEIENNEIDLYRRMEIIESAIDRDINEPNCFFNFMLHEFEGILFSDPKLFAKIFNQDTANKISQIRKQFLTPEHINNSENTAPSKRIRQLIPNYAKIKNGTLISSQIGMDKIISECKHFSNWIQKLKNLPPR